MSTKERQCVHGSYFFIQPGSHLFLSSHALADLIRIFLGSALGADITILACILINFWLLGKKAENLRKSISLLGWIFGLVTLVSTALVAVEIVLENVTVSLREMSFLLTLVCFVQSLIVIFSCFPTPFPTPDPYRLSFVVGHKRLTLSHIISLERFLQFLLQLMLYPCWPS